MQKLLDLLGLVGKSSDDLTRAAKLVFFAAVLMGAYYLAIYINAIGLALPVNIGSMVTLVLVFGLTAAIVVAVVVFYICAGASTTLTAFGERFADLLNISPSGMYLPSVGQQLKTLMVIFILPQMIAGVLMFDYLNWTPRRLAVIGVGIFILPISYGCLRLRCREQWASTQADLKKSRRLLKSYLAVAASIFLLNGMASFSGFLFLFLLDLRGILTSASAFAAGILLVIFVNTIAVTSRVSPGLKTGTPVISKTGEVLVQDGTYRSNGPFAALVLIAISSFPLVAEQVTAATLNLLGLGGGETRTLYLPADDRSSFPPALIDHCDTTYKTCTSKPLQVLLDAGEVMFVHLPVGKNQTMYRVRSADLSESWERRP
ncbi:hypothetical protein [Pinirhizobacter soli]|uniref:hypothetical protein n=1 Tax=Pinirhizobacter soli TaxID=2786953 RepID=UPI00202A3486|nr:hypothetical protein [Pinirhizobacter soli]